MPSVDRALINYIEQFFRIKIAAVLSTGIKKHSFRRVYVRFFIFVLLSEVIQSYTWTIELKLKCWSEKSC